MTDRLEYQLNLELDDVFGEYDLDRAKEAEKMFRQMIAGIVRDAKINCPVETGHLRNSIDGRIEAPFVGVIEVGTNYAGYVEFGTEEMAKAHGRHDPEAPVRDWEAKRERGGGARQMMPFLRPAIITNLIDTRVKMKEVLK
jgi:hypothetical protein